MMVDMPITGAQVVVTGLNGSYAGISSLTGDLSFTLEIGTYQIFASYPMHYKYQNTLSITSLESISTDIVLPVISTLFPTFPAHSLYRYRSDLHWPS